MPPGDRRLRELPSPHYDTALYLHVSIEAKLLAGPGGGFRHCSRPHPPAVIVSVLPGRDRVGLQQSAFHFPRALSHRCRCSHSSATWEEKSLHSRDTLSLYTPLLLQ